MQRQNCAIVGQIIRLDPVAGFNRIGCAAQCVHGNGQRVDVVLEVETVGQRIVQRFLQRGEAVRVVARIQRVERDLDQQCVCVVAGIQQIVGQVKRLF